MDRANPFESAAEDEDLGNDSEIFFVQDFKDNVKFRETDMLNLLLLFAISTQSKVYNQFFNSMAKYLSISSNSDLFMENQSGDFFI